MTWWEGVNETRVLIAPDPSTSGKHVGQFLYLRHPKTGNLTSSAKSLVYTFWRRGRSGNISCYLFTGGVLQELHWFKQSYGSWFLGDYVCEDGRLYIATPVDPVFILLPIFEEARMKKGDDPGKFRQLDEIVYIDGYPGYRSLLSIAEKSMQIVCDLKEIGSTKFFRLNDLKVLRWLCYKVHQLKKTLPTLDTNYAARDEKDTLFDAVSIVGEYLKEEPWLNLLCSKFKLNLQEAVNTQYTEVVLHSNGSGPGSFNPVQKSAKVDKKTVRSTRQTKKAKVEENSKNIKDMFSRAARKGR